MIFLSGGMALQTLEDPLDKIAYEASASDDCNELAIGVCTLLYCKLLIWHKATKDELV